MANGILIAAMNFREVAEDEFHDWYDLEHVPERLGVPGFLNAERWINADDPHVSVATYDLVDVGGLNSAPYLAVAHDRSSPWTKRVTGKCERLLRFEGQQIVPGDRVAPHGAGGLLMVAMNIAAEHEADFNHWYNEEHVPALAAVPGTLCARRYRGSGATQRYAAVYHLTGPEVVDSAAWKAAVDTPWTGRLRAHFRDFLRIRCHRYARGE